MPSVERIAVVTHGKQERIGPALDQVRRVAEDAGAQIVDNDAEAQLAIVLGGDGTMLRALHRFRSVGVPALGINYGRVGFLTSFGPDELDARLGSVLAGEYVVHRLPTLAVTLGDERRIALNDAVGTSSTLGRMIEVGYAVGGEDLGIQPCDGIICATPSGSTAYNLSSGGPVLVWGLEAMVVTFVAPHSLHVRPLVVPRGQDLTVRNETPDVSMTVIADGHSFGSLAPGESYTVGLDDQSALLATTPEETFFTRYERHFAH
jgi:NAD+ kinase